MLGILSGVLASILFLPTALPLTRALANSEEALAVTQARSAAAMSAHYLDDDGALDPGTLDALDLDHLHVVDAQGLTIHHEGVDLPGDIAERACSAEAASEVLMDEDRVPWAVGCVTAGNNTVVAASVAQPSGYAARMVLLVVGLAAIAGILTALFILRVLTPISRVSSALGRVIEGQRGVRLVNTGLAELDELVARLNATARAMEDREDAYTARLQVVRELARMVAHEVRNPLQSLELLTTLIAGEEDPDERLQLAEAIQEEIRTLDAVVTRLLKGGPNSTRGLWLSRMRRSLVPIIEDVVLLRGPEARKYGLTLETGQLDETETSIDRALMRRALENLLSNAMQALEPKRSGTVRISVRDQGAMLDLVVEDSGPGVPEHLSASLFEPDVSGRTEGTGLGLSLVRGVVEAHRGSVRYDRSPLGGARFIVTLPIED